MALQHSRFDVADYLKTETDVEGYLNAALELEDPAVFAKAIGDVARARGMSSIARATRLTRESLYRSLSERGNPQLDSLLRILSAIGVRLAIRPVTRASQPKQAKTRAGPRSRKPAPGRG